ncbi:ABC transporter substrate-binding protein [Candidatus Omnitrophota bacterium]
MIKVKQTKAFLFCALFFWLGSVVPSYALNIAVVKSRDIQAYNVALEGFKQKVRQSLPGERIDFWIAASLNGEKELASEVIDSIKAKRPAVIFALGSNATALVQKEFPDIPIVFSMVFNPVASGFVNSMHSSGNNLTGASLDISIWTQFSKLILAVPGARKIGVIYSIQENEELIQQASNIARAMNLELVLAPVKSSMQVSGALDRLIGRIDALWSVSDCIVFTPQSTQYILMNTLRNKIPFMALSPSYVKAGALLALSCDYKDVGRQAGEIAVQVITGKEPANIPIATPRQVSLSINLIVARQMRLRIPSDVIASAEKIFR